MAPGLQAAQACHALRQFTDDHPELDEQWNRHSKFLAILSVQDELALWRLTQRAVDASIPVAVWREPDIGHQVTGIALAPGPASARLCSQLPLALREHSDCMQIMDEAV